MRGEVTEKGRRGLKGQRGLKGRILVHAKHPVPSLMFQQQVEQVAPVTSHKSHGIIFPPHFGH